MPGTRAPRPGHRHVDRSSLRSSLIVSATVPALALAGLWLVTMPQLIGQERWLRVAVGSVIAVAGVAFILVKGRSVSRETLGGLERLETEAGELAATARHSEQLAEIRESSRKVFLNLARRTQVLIHRQIAMLDAMERKHEDPELLKELFAVDHLSTRMRRHAENLVILGGDLPARQWRSGVLLMNVLRSAVSETEEYTRVKVEQVPRVTVVGRGVADVVHLISELIENGTSFSPPHTQVHVSAHEVAHGLVIEVEDRGLGMPDEELLRLNTLLTSTEAIEAGPIGDDPRLGAHVVARLAQRHGVHVSLRRSPYGGTLAIILLPQSLLEQPGQGATGGLPPGAKLSGVGTSASRLPSPTPSSGPTPGPDPAQDHSEVRAILSALVKGDGPAGGPPSGQAPADGPNPVAGLGPAGPDPVAGEHGRPTGGIRVPGAPSLPQGRQPHPETTGLPNTAGGPRVPVQGTADSRSWDRPGRHAGPAADEGPVAGRLPSRPRPSRADDSGGTGGPGGPGGTGGGNTSPWETAAPDPGRAPRSTGDSLPRRSTAPGGERRAPHPGGAGTGAAPGAGGISPWDASPAAHGRGDAFEGRAGTAGPGPGQQGPQDARAPRGTAPVDPARNAAHGVAGGRAGRLAGRQAAQYDRQDPHDLRDQHDRYSQQDQPYREEPRPPADEPVTPAVLPKRVKQASLAVQLRQAAEAEAWAGRGTQDQRPGQDAAPAPTPSPEASRARMAAIQAATRRARDANADGGGDAAPHPPSAPKDHR